MDMVSSPINLDVFENEKFDVDNYVKKVAADSIYASNIADTKEKLKKSMQQTSEEIKQSVYKNYSNFMETAKEVGHLEGKMSQLRQSLEEQRKLLYLFKNLNINSINFNDATTAQQKEQLKSGSAPASNFPSTPKSSLALLLEQVEGCGLITQKPGRNLLYHSDLEALHLDDYSVSHKLHAYLLSDALLLTLPQRKRTKTNVNASSINTMVPGIVSGRPLITHGNLLAPSVITHDSSSSSSQSSSSSSTYQYKFQAFYELQDIKITNIDDSKEVRNSFQILKFPESLAFRCANAHIKKEWLENIENAKKELQFRLDREREKKLEGLDLSSSIIEEEEEDGDQKRTNENDNDDNDDNDEKNKSRRKRLDSLTYLNNLSEYERNKILREQFSDFDILLAQRDFDKAIETLLKIKQQHQKQQTNAAAGGLDSVQQLIYKQKEAELISILRKDLLASKERGNSKGVVKTGKRVVNSLIKLRIYDEAVDLFIDYHKHLNSETLKKIKLEESNSVYMNNVLNLFFENMRGSYQAYSEAFKQIVNHCYSSYLSWCDTEIEILIKKLQSQHYLGRHFDLTIENCELIFSKAKEFSENVFEVRFMFETKLSGILEASIKEQNDILIEASYQRSKLELDENAAPPHNEQTKQAHVESLLADIGKRELSGFSSEKDIGLLKSCTSSAVQFSRGLVNFFCDCMRVHYQDINFAIVEAFIKLFKGELKIYKTYLNTQSAKSRQSDVAAAAAAIVNNEKKPLAPRVKRQDIQNNFFLIEKIFNIVDQLYTNKAGVQSKHFVKLAQKFQEFKRENFKS
jgi:exocyst complex component 8